MFDVSPNSSGNTFRRKRIAILNDLIASFRAQQQVCRILDVGGTSKFWDVWRDAIDWDFVEVVCLNLPGTQSPSPGSPVLEFLEGDARAMPQIPDAKFDICFSNSVIEHVGSWNDMSNMATEISRVAKSFLVQTPNFWFPIEPHARTPFLHWLPEPLAYRIVMSRRCGFWERRLTVADASRAVQSAHLLDARQLGALFPDAEIRRERFAGITKSLMAIRTNQAAVASAAAA